MSYGKEDFILERHNKDIAVARGSDSTPNTARKAGGLQPRDRVMGSVDRKLQTEDFKGKRMPAKLT